MSKKTDLKNLIKKLKIKKSSTIGILFDGINVTPSEIELQLLKIKEYLDEIGKIQYAKVILQGVSSEGIVRIIQNLGFEPLIYVSESDVYFVLEAMELIFNPKIEVVAIASKNEDFLPLLIKAKGKGKKNIAFNLIDSKIDVETLKNNCDIVIDLNQLKNNF
ncbi:MAG: NYN domain-containing protein [Candidatus Odinarchaeia archaeon]